MIVLCLIQRPLRAAKKLKYKPTVRDGRAVAVTDIPHKFTYEIDEDS